MDSNTLLEQVKTIVRAYIREELQDRTVAGSSQRKQVQQQSSIDNMMRQLELAIADGNRRKLEKSKRNPEFQKTIADIGQLIGELQGMLQQPSSGMNEQYRRGGYKVPPPPKFDLLKFFGASPGEDTFYMSDLQPEINRAINKKELVEQLKDLEATGKIKLSRTIKSFKMDTKITLSPEYMRTVQKLPSLERVAWWQD